MDEVTYPNRIAAGQFPLLDEMARLCVERGLTDVRIDYALPTDEGGVYGARTKAALGRLEFDFVLASTVDGYEGPIDGLFIDVTDTETDGTIPVTDDIKGPNYAMWLAIDALAEGGLVRDQKRLALRKSGWCECDHPVMQHQTGDGPWTGMCYGDPRQDCKCEGPNPQKEDQ